MESTVTGTEGMFMFRQLKRKFSKHQELSEKMKDAGFELILSHVHNKAVSNQCEWEVALCIDLF